MTLSRLRTDVGRERWAARTEAPLLALAVAFLAAFVLPLYVPDLPHAV